MRQTIRLRHLPGAETAFAGGVLRSLAVAASHPDVIVGAGGGGLAGGVGEKEEVGAWAHGTLHGPGGTLCP